MVCGNHPDKAWSDELGCQCGVGMPCEYQTVQDEFDKPDVIIGEQ